MFAQLGYYVCIPFAWLTRMFYQLTGSYGIALILFTLVVKLVLLPFQFKSKKSMMRMNRMQGKLKDIQTRYANNKEKQQQEMADLYAREGINPMSGCLWSFIPLPIMIALYYIISKPLRFLMNMSEEAIAELGKFAATLGYVAPKGNAYYDQIFLTKFAHDNWAQFEGKFERLIDLDYNFLGIDLSNTASSVLKDLGGAGWSGWGIILIVLLAAGLQLVMSLVTMKQQGDNGAQGANKTMMFMGPIMTLWFGYMLPASLAVYWAANAGFSCIQEIILGNYFSKKMDAEETEKEREKREKRAAKMMAQREAMAKMQAEQDAQKGKKSGGQKSGGAKKAKPEQSGKQPGTNENGRVGNRPYARGRAYSDDHYAD